VSASHQPCRDLLAEVMREVRERVPADHVAHGPGGLYIPAVACCLWASKAEGWQGYLAARAPERLPTRPRGGAREGAGRPVRGERARVSAYLDADELETLAAAMAEAKATKPSGALRWLLRRYQRVLARRGKRG